MSEVSDTPAPRQRLVKAVLELLHPAIALPLALVGILFASPLLYRGYRIARVPEIEPPFDVEQFLDFDVPADRNAFVEYRTAEQTFVPAGRRDYRYWQRLSAGTGWGDILLQHRRWLAVNQDALQTWRQGTRKPDALRRHPRELELLDERNSRRFQPTEFSCLALLQSASLQHAGRHDESWDWLLAAFRFSRHLALHADTPQRSTSIYIHTHVCGGIVSWAAHPEVTTGQLRDARRHLRYEYRRTPPVSRTVKIDYIVLERFLDRPDAARHFSRMVPRWGSPHGKGGWKSHPLHYLGEPELFRRLLRHITANRLAAIDRPAWKTPPQGRYLTLYAYESKHRPDGVLPWHELDRFCRWSPISSALIPRTGGLVSLTQGERARQHGVILALACREFEKRHGRLPASLSELPEYVGEIPPDPFSPTGAAMNYRRTETGAVIWSVGIDGTDQRGELSLKKWPFDLGYELRSPIGEQVANIPDSRDDAPAP